MNAESARLLTEQEMHAFRAAFPRKTTPCANHCYVAATGAAIPPARALACGHAYCRHCLSEPSLSYDGSCRECRNPQATLRIGR